jgi:hypothetical protein
MTKLTKRIRHDELHAEIRNLKKHLSDAKTTLLTASREISRWAKQSVDDGWSTHQVELNLSLAEKLRTEANLIED